MFIQCQKNGNGNFKIGIKGLKGASFPCNIQTNFISELLHLFVVFLNLAV